jgi:galactokinase/mevalonate kinase-like predicted kinase
VEDEAFKVRVLASIKLLKKASEVATDPKLKQMLLDEAEKLARYLQGDAETLKQIARENTVDAIAEEIRNWIWSTRIEPRTSESKIDALVEQAFKEIEGRINKIVKSLEQALEMIDKGIVK